MYHPARGGHPVEVYLRSERWTPSIRRISRPWSYTACEEWLEADRVPAAGDEGGTSEDPPIIHLAPAYACDICDICAGSRA